MKQILRFNGCIPLFTPCLLMLLCLFPTLLTSCDSSAFTSSSSTSSNKTLPTNNGPVTYSTSPNDVLIRTFYGGGNLGTLDYSPVATIYGDGTFILGPGLQMRWGKLTSGVLQQLLHTLVDTEGLLNMSRRQFYDVPDQNATLLRVTLDNRHFEFLYGKFGSLQESTQDIEEYHGLEHALSAITAALGGTTHTYTSKSMALLARQDFSPDLTQDIPYWTLKDFTLYQLAAYECGVTPPDETGPNADTGCLTFTAPRSAYLPTPQQQQTITRLLDGQRRGEFIEQGLYYTVYMRPLLPDELQQKVVAMLGSQQLTYTGVPLYSGVVPEPTVTPS